MTRQETLLTRTPFEHQMSAREFRDDDAGYRAWLAAHPDGFVINVARSYSATTARVHHAHCRTINGQNPHRGAWTGPYVKVCAQYLAELEAWAGDHVGIAIPTCGTCHPVRRPGRHSSTKQPERTIAAPPPDGRFRVHRPTANSAAVQVWTDDYIRFERLPDWQKRVRTEIKTSCGHLEPSARQVLHATYFGAKPPNADIENLLLYNIGSFRVAGRNGIRFEHGVEVPPASDGAEYPFCYRYSLTPRSGSFTDWKEVRTLASFDWTDLGAFASDKQAARVWLALARGEVQVFEPAGTPEMPFAVKLHVRPPTGRQPVWGNLVKGLFDGVICALQAHTDISVLPKVVTRLAKVLLADPAELEEYLLDQRRAVLGVVQRLVSPYREGVKWDPADHLCVAGELLASEAVDDRWAVKGEVVELTR